MIYKLFCLFPQSLTPPALFPPACPKTLPPCLPSPNLHSSGLIFQSRSLCPSRPSVSLQARSTVRSHQLPVSVSLCPLHLHSQSHQAPCPTLLLSLLPGPAFVPFEFKSSDQQGRSLRVHKRHSLLSAPCPDSNPAQNSQEEQMQEKSSFSSVALGWNMFSCSVRVAHAVSAPKYRRC